jgi:DNA topoisomerase VI subunit B
MTAAAAPRLVRETYSVSRLSEFASERELTAQIGYGVEDWPLVVGKELVDNALDAAEESDIAPMISVEVSTDRGLIVVTDNGPGIRPETVEALCDYSRRTSSRAHVVSPSRGQQGNAWQTILAAAFVLDGTRGEMTVEARGITHRIGFEVDPIRREPRISYETGASDVKIGTRVTVRWPDKGMPLLDRAKGRFFQLLDEYGWLNPHIELAGSWDGKALVKVLPTDPAWPKWGPSDPTSPHWYSPGRLENLIAAQVALDQDRGRSRLVREFVADFRGLAGTAKTREVLGETGYRASR